jgi:hypothetical protein
MQPIWIACSLLSPRLPVSYLNGGMEARLQDCYGLKPLAAGSDVFLSKRL